MKRPTLIPAAILSVLVGFCGCSSMGPRTIPRDRFDYSRSIGESWKRQTLLNMVKLRYLDVPTYVEVGQIVAGYSLETELSVGATLEDPNNSVGLGGSGRYTDRPTITYVPQTGQRFIRASLMPLPPDSVFFMIQAGWPADGVLFTAISSINGLKNQESSYTGVTPPDPEFLRVLELLKKIQQSGAVAVRIQQDPQKQQTTLLTFRSKDASPETLSDIAEVRRLLRLDPDAHEFKMVFAANPANDKELAVVTRSLIQIMAMMAAHVEVPEKDIREGRATPGLGGTKPLKIGCSERKPQDAFIAVNYRDHWFWIDDRDLRTKRAFGLLMMMNTLSDTGDHQQLPLITIPAQ